MGHNEWCPLPKKHIYVQSPVFMGTTSMTFVYSFVSSPEDIIPMVSGEITSKSHHHFSWEPPTISNYIPWNRMKTWQIPLPSGNFT